MASGTIKDKLNCYTTDWLNPTFSNQIQVALGTLSQLTNGVITDIANVKGIAIVTNGALQVYSSGSTAGNSTIYVYVSNLVAITTSSYKIKISFFY